MVNSPDWAFNRAFLITLFVFIFYTGYSLWIGSNSSGAIFADLAVQMKPYLGFFCVYQLKPFFSNVRKKLLRDISLLLWMLFLLPVGISSIFYERVFQLLMEHPAYYGIAVTIVSLCYLYGSRYTMRDKIVFLALLSIGIFCGRSKFYGFYAMSFFVVFFFSEKRQFKLDSKTVLILTGMIVFMGIVAWEKISLYFYQAIVGAGDVEEDMIARYALYYTMPEILHDYFPFGSGLASYATYSSGTYYSELYVQYGLDNVWGLSKGFHNFVSDTYYPSLAQFGVAGIILFVLFWVYVIRKAFHANRQSKEPRVFTIILMIIGFLAIESTTGSTIIAQGGFFMMMLLGAILAETKSSGQAKINHSGDEKVPVC
jgi:hypothetical protein